MKVRDRAGTERWFYASRIDGTIGPGRADLRGVSSVTEAHQLEQMLASNQVLRADDPDYAPKVKAGRILVWGGSPTGAWAAEPVIHQPGSRVTVMGDVRGTPRDWPKIVGEYVDVLGQLSIRPDDSALVARHAALEGQLAEAHTAMAVPRNRAPGATYDRTKSLVQRAPGDVQIEFGSPTKIELQSGRVVVTTGTGEHAMVRVYDQVVIAHGQDPAAPGGPGALLGPGAPEVTGVDGLKTYGKVPKGTIELRPIWGPRREGHEPDLLGLETIDPPGLRLLGAAQANEKMARWVVEGERDAFVKAVDRMATAGAPTRDHGPISEHSTRVASGIEVQRDRIPRANEVLAAKTYRLPGTDKTIELDPAHQERWDEQVRAYFATNMRADRRWVRVERLGGGRSKAVLFKVFVGDNEVGVFKVFDGRGGAATEARMLDLLAKAKLTRMTAVRERGQVGVAADTGMNGDALLMDAAEGESVAKIIDHLPKGPQAEPTMKMLKAAVRMVAGGLAEMHAHFTSKGANGETVMMKPEEKRSDATYMLDKNFRPGPRSDVDNVRAALGADFERVKGALEGPVFDEFLAAQVPATAYHGDANTGNFILKGYEAKGRTFDGLGVIDVGSMSYSIAGMDAKPVGTKTGANDVARFLGSLEMQTDKLTTAQLAKLRGAFMETYFAIYRNDQDALDRSSYAIAEKWYRLEFELAVLKSDPRAKARIMSILGLEVTP